MLVYRKIWFGKGGCWFMTASETRIKKQYYQSNTRYNPTLKYFESGYETHRKILRKFILLQINPEREHGHNVRMQQLFSSFLLQSAIEEEFC